MEELKKFINATDFSDEDKNSLIVLSEQVISFLDIFNPNQNEIDLVIKRYHNRLLDDSSRRCLYIFKNYLKQSIFKDDSGSVFYLFRQIVEKNTKELRYKY